VFEPRPGQVEVINYKGGKMGVSAVPGSGKTHTLSYLAAKLVASEMLGINQEVLIVTLVNSAVDNFACRVAGFLSEMGLIPGVGYRVRTLHGLAYDIVREHPDRIGLDNHFSIIDERAAIEILDMFTRAWMQTNQSILEELTHENFQYENKIRQWHDLLRTLAANFIKQAKDFQFSPEMVDQLAERNSDHALLQFVSYIYGNYQQSLRQRGSVDFEDLIRFAYQLITNDASYRERLRIRWPVILEDEAQDSSLIQEKLLRSLCGKDGNWVRVGDPNQAIFETFTTANPKLLRSFLEEPGVDKIDLKHSGRSTQSIINLANQFIEWTMNCHPNPSLRNALSDPFIHPTPAGDPQKNPTDNPEKIYLNETSFTAERELSTIARSIKKWISQNPEKTIAVLIPRNSRGAELAEELEKLGVPYIERLRSSKPTRDVAAILAAILGFLANPNYRRSINAAFEAIIKPERLNQDLISNFRSAIQSLTKKFSPETLMDPNVDEWEDSIIEFGQRIMETVRNTIRHLQKWQFAAALPIDQLIMTISMDLFSEPSDLALAHKLAVRLEADSSINPTSDLANFKNQLDMISQNRVNFYGFSDDDLVFNPDLYPGKVVITTYHKAKGLEWDRVYLMSVNNYNFPSGQENDIYLSERWFVRDELNLEAELISFLKNYNESRETSVEFIEGKASHKARLDYCAERLRLLFVGMTRAREELVITWNTGKRGNCVEALPLHALREWHEGLYGR